jgi:formylglycine-generating enzyme required for sulfatase activity
MKTQQNLFKVSFKMPVLFLCLLLLFTVFGRDSFCQSVNTKASVIAGIVMVNIPGGSFDMGSAKGQVSERPVHKVEIAPFLIGATEITQRQYKAVVGKNPSNSFGVDSLAVDRVSWVDAVKFCNMLSDKAGLERCYDETTCKCDFSKNGFRLPTEAEWEYACRAGTKTSYYFGDSPAKISDYAWFGNIEIGNCDNIPHAVGMKKPNSWGLFDMCGSNWEWCNDWYGEDYYKSSPAQNPKGPDNGKLRVMRGGSWINNPDSMTSSYREQYVTSLSYLDIGIRVVMNSKNADR